MAAQKEDIKDHPAIKLLMLKNRFDAAAFNALGRLDTVIDTKNQHRAFRNNLLAQFEGQYATRAELEDAMRRRELTARHLDGTDPVPPHVIEPLISEHAYPDGMKAEGYLPALRSVAADTEVLLLREVIPPFKKAKDADALDRCRSLVRAARKVQGAASVMVHCLGIPASIIKVDEFKKCLSQFEDGIEAVTPLLSEAPVVTAIAPRRRVKRMKGSLPRRRHVAPPFIPTPFQMLILEKLDRAAMKSDQLGRAVKGRRRLFKKNGIKELQEKGRVKHHDRVGYYRPDRPPPEHADILGEVAPKGHQKGTN